MELEAEPLRDLHLFLWFPSRILEDSFGPIFHPHILLLWVAVGEGRIHFNIPLISQLHYKLTSGGRIGFAGAMNWTNLVES